MFELVTNKDSKNKIQILIFSDEFSLEEKADYNIIKMPFNAENLSKIQLETDFDVVLFQPKTDAEIEQILKINIPCICLTEIFDFAILAMENGAITCFRPNSENYAKLFEQIENIAKKNRKIRAILADSKMPLISKSPAIQATIRQIKKLRNAHTISLTGEIGVGKKFIATKMLEFWKNNYIFINSEDEIPKINNYIENFKNNVQKTTIIITHPEQFSQNSQQKLLHLNQNSIGNNKIQWIFIINQKDIDNLVGNLKQRISIFNIRVPNLAERTEDLEQIVRIFQRNISKKLGKKARIINLETITKKTWTTNFIQLKLYIEQMFYIERQIDELHSSDLLFDDFFLTKNLKDSTTIFERIYLQKQIVLQEHNIQKTAKIAGINRTTLYRKLKEQ